MRNLASVYGDKSPSFGSKRTLALIHCWIVLGVLWLLFDGGIPAVDRILGAQHQIGSVLRRIALATAAFLYFLRTLATLFVFLKRRMPWVEAVTIAVWVGIVNLLFAYLGGRNEAPLGKLGLVAAFLIVLGSILNTVSEWQRHVWKRRPENKGHLFTLGLFHYSRHINYFGDVVLFTGWSLMTGRLALLVIPAVMIGGFVFINIPALDRYLSERYGEEYRMYEKNTAGLIPYVF